MNVVLIDDDTALLRSLEIILAALGCNRIESFSDAFAACEHIENGEAPDVLIVDQVMPEFTGTQVIQRLKEYLPEHCRIILVSGHTDLIEPLDLEAMGISAFLPKPIDFDRLRILLAENNEMKEKQP